LDNLKDPLDFNVDVDLMLLLLKISWIAVSIFSSNGGSLLLSENFLSRLELTLPCSSSKHSSEDCLSLVTISSFLCSTPISLIGSILLRQPIGNYC
jgi:hypothetical protein